MTELHYNTLKQALEQLPQHTPPGSIWAGIEQALHEEAQLTHAVNALPQYAPPADIWASIEAQLPAAAASPTGWTVWTNTRLRYAAAAAVLLVVFTGWLLLWRTNAPEMDTNSVADAPVINTPAPEQTTAPVPAPATVPAPAVARPQRPAPTPVRTPDVVTTQSIVVVDNTLLDACQIPEDASFALIEQICVEQLPVCENATFKALKSELEDLSRAKQALQQALGQYADDPELVSQMVAIEQNRIEIIQKMIQLI
jgi:hypothetical protein